MNAAIEAHKLALAETWLSRATEEMKEEPQVLLEKERYLSFKESISSRLTAAVRSSRYSLTTEMGWSISVTISSTLMITISC